MITDGRPEQQEVLKKEIVKKKERKKREIVNVQANGMSTAWIKL